MIDFTKMNGVAVVADNKVSIGGLEYMLTDDECIKVRDIINGLISTRNQPKQSLAPATSTSTTTQTQQSKKSKKSDKFPNLGEPTCTLTYITAYSKLVRYWEVQRFVPDKVKYALKHAIAEAGGEWNKDKGAYEFKTVKACNDFLKAQKAREEANKKK